LAYDPGEASGDSGWGVSLELNRKWPLGYAYLKALTPYLVAQLAHVSVHQGSLPIDRLGSAGVGLRLSDDRHYAVDLTVAQPFGDRPLEAGRRRPRINLAFSYQLR
jgi:hemolysin activation/secretion protein